MTSNDDGLPDAEGLHPRVLAHLGDGVFDVFIREKALTVSSGKVDDVHQFTTSRVNAEFQTRLLKVLENNLTDTEKDWVRRGRNVPVAVSRRNDQATHRQATGFEALIGYLYLTDQSRLQALYEEMTPFIEDPKKLP